MAPLGILALALFAQAKAPTLEPATAIDIRVKSVVWHPAGRALLYQREENQGTAIGLFAPGQKQGQLLLHLGKDDSWEAQWFDASTDVAVIVYHPYKEGNEEYRQVTIHLLNADKDTDKPIYERHAPASQKLDVDLDPSPSLLHAIFRIKENGKAGQFVMPAGGGQLIESNDIEQAVAQGYSGPAWSIDGTANYSKGNAELGARVVEAEAKADLVQFSQAAQANQGNDDKAKALRVQLLESLEYSRALLAARSAPEAGSPVLEVMPASGLMRPVRFRGPWNYKLGSLPNYQATGQKVTVQFGASKGQANSLWLALAPAAEKGAPAIPPTAVLVTPEADKACLSPVMNGISYLTSGALFVRMFK